MTITASQAGNETYAATQAEQTIAIAKAQLTMKANDQSKVYEGVSYHDGNGIVITGFKDGDNALNSLKGTLEHAGNSGL